MELVMLGIAVLLMRVGQALFGVSICRSKNAAGAALHALADLCVAVLAFWALGARFVLIIPAGYEIRPTNLPNQFFFAATVVLISTGAVTSALAERTKFFALWAVSAVMAAVIVPLGWKWSADGWLHDMGFVDIAGATWIHLAAGACAAVGAILVGPRVGKYNRDGSANMIPAHNVPLAAVSVLILFVAWTPYVAGLARFNAAAYAGNVLLAAAAAGVAAMLLTYFRYGKPDIMLTLMGFTGGLVAITAARGSTSHHSAALIGAIAGILIPLTSIWIDLVLKIDDPGGAISIHGVGGAWGALAAGIFIKNPILEHFKLIGVQLLGIIAIAALAAAVSFAALILIKLLFGLRSKEADEFDGLDLAEHDIGAYPDFQQTMIKSYHLREA